MLGVIFTGVAQLFAEISTSLGKYEFQHKRESIYVIGFLNAAWATVFIIAIGLIRDSFVFSFESIPTLAIRTILEIILMFVSINAVLTADRSTYAFLRTLTIPLLLAADIILGYALSLQQMLGISVMIAALVFLTLNHGLSRRGKMLTLFSALIPVATISLYKYNITYYNSVEAEQTIIHVILLIVLIIVARVRTGENILRSIAQPRYFVQSVTAGIAYAFLSYSYLFAPASVITACKRAFEVLFSLCSGHVAFREKHIVLKLCASVLLVGGVLLTIL